MHRSLDDSLSDAVEGEMITYLTALQSICHVHSTAA